MTNFEPAARRLDAVEVVARQVQTGEVQVLGGKLRPSAASGGGPEAVLIKTPDEGATVVGHGQYTTLLPQPRAMFSALGASASQGWTNLSFLGSGIVEKLVLLQQVGNANPERRGQVAKGEHSGVAPAALDAANIGPI